MQPASTTEVVSRFAFLPLLSLCLVLAVVVDSLFGCVYAVAAYGGVGGASDCACHLHWFSKVCLLPLWGVRCPCGCCSLEYCNCRCCRFAGMAPNEQARDTQVLVYFSIYQGSILDPIWLWLKKPVPTWNPGKWKHGSTPA